MTPEGKVKKKITTRLNVLGIYYCMPIGTKYGTSGHPDILTMIPPYAGPHAGKLVGLECKADEKKKPTPLQEQKLQEIKSNGGQAFVIHAGNVDQFLDKYYPIPTKILEPTDSLIIH